MIQTRFRASAWPSAPKYRSPDTLAASGPEPAGAGFDTARRTDALSLPPRQNAKRIAHSRRRHDSTLPARLHSIKVAAGLIGPISAGNVDPGRRAVMLC